MKVKINGKWQEIENALSLEHLLLQENLPEHFVVAVNYECIAKQNYQNIFLRDGDEIEILTPMQGG